ncbi:hypothetical protein [Kordia sp.]|uniref:hypothetical protein n=1 Tax=Kordia sp. TaxID=1965332 RepID=UPI003D2BB748
MKKKNINYLALKKESVSNLNGIFGGKEDITFEYTCNTVVICAPGETQIDCPLQRTLHITNCNDCLTGSVDQLC